MPPSAVAVSSSTTMSVEILAEEPREIWIDEHTRRRLEELCSQMANVFGLTESVLQLALVKQGTERTGCVETALAVSSRATRAIKLFLGEWSVLGQDSNRDVLRAVEGLKQSVLQGRAEDAVLPTLDEICDAYIQQVLESCGGNRQRAAQILGIGRTSLYRYERAMPQPTRSVETNA